MIQPSRPTDTRSTIPHPRLHSVDPVSDPWASDDHLAHTWTVRDLYVAHVAPTLRTRATREDYARSLDRFDGFCAAFPISSKSPQRSDADRIVNPVLAQITAKSLVAFQRWLRSQGHPPRATNKTIGSIRAILAKGARLGILEQAPTIDSVPYRSASTIYTLSQAELSRIYHACDVATWPTYRRSSQATPGRWPLPYPAADGWRALIVLLATYGMRTEDAITLSPTGHGLTWSSIRRDSRTPHPAGKLTNPDGWLSFVPTKTSGIKPDPLILPITPLVRHHLDRLRVGLVPVPSAPVFDWPTTAGSAERGLVGFYWQWQRILEAANVTATGWSDEPVKLLPKHLRKTCVTWLEDHRPGVSKYVTGHAAERSGGITTEVQARHYRRSETPLVEALLTVPILGGFTR